jgi:glycosyltransferase involved in cell wall biosynthesis
MSADPTRVVLIAPGFAPTTGGVETHVGALARGLSMRGIDVEAWVPDRTVSGSLTERVDDLVVRRFASTRSTRFPIAPGLYQYARTHLDDRTTVHVHGFHNIAAAAVLAARTPVPFVFTPHFHGGGHTRLATVAHLGYRPVGGRLFAQARAVIAVSDAEAGLIGRRFPLVRPQVIHNGADVADIAAAAGRPAEAPTVLVLGRLESYKRVDRTIEAFARTRAGGQLVIIGDGPDRDRLTRLARQSCRAPDIRFLGRLPRADVHSWLRTARCVVSLSEHEAFGLVALEAAAAGASAVLSDIPAHREVARMLPAGVVALVPSTPAAIAGELDRLIPTPRSSAREVRDWSTVADEHLEVYRDVATRRDQ